MTVKESESHADERGFRGDFLRGGGFSFHSPTFSQFRNIIDVESGGARVRILYTTDGSAYRHDRGSIPLLESTTPSA